MRDIKISDHYIGPSHRCFVIAEAGVNHNGSIELAHHLVDAAANAGADAVKFQTFDADRLASPLAEKALYQLSSTDPAESQVEMLQRLQLTSENHYELKQHCDQRNMLFLSSPFEEASADFLDNLGVNAFKLPSGELTNLGFLRHVASKGKPVIMSTGMANLGEVEKAVEILGGVPLALLHCTSAYPADISQCNLRAMTTLSVAFDLPVGFSDHTPGITAAIAATALGARIIEKHFTVDCSLPGPDHHASLEPNALSEMIKGIRDTEAALGNGIKRPQPVEMNTAAVARKSVVSLHDIPAGTMLTSEMLSVMRPGTGIEPSFLKLLSGRVLSVSVNAGTPLQWHMLK